MKVFARYMFFIWALVIFSFTAVSVALAINIRYLSGFIAGLTLFALICMFAVMCLRLKEQISEMFKLLMEDIPFTPTEFDDEDPDPDGGDDIPEEIRPQKLKVVGGSRM